MPDRQTTLLEELVPAARGSAALLIGNRQAPAFFDFTRRGLAGSFIAFLIATVINAYVPELISPGSTGLAVWRVLVMAAVLLATQFGFSAIVLRQINRLDGFVPYLVAYNWTTFFVLLISTVIEVVGIGSGLEIVALGIAVLVIQINIARLIVTLTPLQIAMFLIAQVVGVLVGILLLALLMPVPPEALSGPASGV